MLAALDLVSGQITYRIRERKRWRGFLALLNLLRAPWPGCLGDQLQALGCGSPEA